MDNEQKLKQILLFCKDKKYWQEQLHPEDYEDQTAWIFVDYIIQMIEE